jgi:hypothetical protein
MVAECFLKQQEIHFGRLQQLLVQAVMYKHLNLDTMGIVHIIKLLENDYYRKYFIITHSSYQFYTVLLPIFYYSSI